MGNTQIEMNTEALSNTDANTSRLESDIVTITHSKPTSSTKWVPALAKMAISAVTPHMHREMRGTLAGQDYALVCHPVPKDVRQTISLICDGHGEYGELFSVHAGEFLANKVEAAWEQLKSYCYADEGFEASGGKAFMGKFFEQAEEYLERTLGTFTGGTTATMCAIVDGAFVVTANVGDTTAMIVHDDGSYEMLSCPHSADSPEEYARYRQRCKEDKVQPHEFVYNRFNCPGGPRLPGPDDTHKPIPIFELNEHGAAVAIPKSAAYIQSLGHHGGVQSVRKHVINDPHTGEAMTDPNKIHENWGSTVAGRPQNTRMLGDFSEKKMLHLDAVADVSCTVLDRVHYGMCWLLVASDGVTDAHWYEDIAGRFVEQHRAGVESAQELCQSMIVDTLANARAANFAFKNDLPAWDDLSCTLLALPGRAAEPIQKAEEGEAMHAETGEGAASDFFFRQSEFPPLAKATVGVADRRT